MPSLDESLRGELDLIEQAHRYRRRKIIDVIDPVAPTHVRVRADGIDRECVSFCSNDYLGLSGHIDVRRAMAAAAERYGVGSGAAHLVTGHSSEHHALEDELAAFVGRERALCYSTGYMANLGVASALFKRGDTVIEDRLNHASLIDAGLQQGVEFSRYQHNDLDVLQSYLSISKASRKWVLSDGVFSMDGDIAQLKELASRCHQYSAWLMIDDAHGFGVLGEQGKGSVNSAGLSADDVPIYMATLGKALGVCGAFIAGSNELVETLIQKSRTYIYTTATPPAVAAATREALQVLQRESWRREVLHTHIRRFRAGAKQLGLKLMESSTAIQPLMMGNEVNVLRASTILLEEGFVVTAIRPPTVPQGTARLRITLSAAHSETDIDRLLDALSRLPVIAP
ncbi:MAG TPA: 8-amino-7-oxononanoate synthase [Steroidobacteraceae bacterium]|nr:8-amino-7-oxononanoate synthase [Steroidobacteraceae bacterium]